MSDASIEGLIRQLLLCGLHWQLDIRLRVLDASLFR